MAILVQDSFNRADTTAGLGNADTGQTWQKIGTNNFGIVNNQAYQVTGTNGIAYIDIGVSDCLVSVKNAGGLTYTNLALRVTDANNLISIQNDGTKYYIYKRVSGTFTALGSVTQATVANDVVKVRLQGTTIELFINGVSKLTVTASEYVTNTKHGISPADNTRRFDDFLIESLDGGTPTTQDGTASIIGTGTISATATNIKNALASIVGTGTLTASPVIIKEGQTSLVGQGLLVANADTLAGVVIIDGSASLLGQGILTANADTIHIPTTIDGVFTSLGTGFLTADGEVIEFIEPEPPAVTVDMVLDLLFDTENYVLLTSDIETELHLSSELENKVSLTFNL